MNELTTLERRGLAAISTPAGRMLIVAADQRNSMKAVMVNTQDGPGSVTFEQLADAKADLVRHLGNHAPAILLDPEVALPRVVDDATLARARRWWSVSTRPGSRPSTMCGARATWTA